MKIFRLLSIVSVIAALSMQVAVAQNRILMRGRVLDAANGEPLVAVSVVEIDRDNRVVTGVQTDMDGNYSISVRGAEGSKLQFSYIGYKSQTAPIGNAAVVNARLEEDNMELDEVVVTARKRVSIGALNIDDRDMTFAYSRVDAKDLDALPVSSIDQALQGRMSGVDIVANSGAPGAGMSIRIRGTASINNSADPLIVVNGIPYETTISSDFDFSTADEESYSQLLNISPADIEEITVLKDAAATALYGSKGANGVLMITTKKGAMGKPRLSYSFKGSISVPRDAIPTLNGDQYSTLISESFFNAGIPMSYVTYPEFANDPSNPYYYYNFGQNTDWVDALLRNSFKQEHNFALSGGGERATYRLSVGYLDEDGNIINTNYNRFTTTLNLNYNISDRISVVAEMSYVHGQSHNAYMKDVLGNTYTKMPNQSIYRYTDQGVLTPNFFSPENTPQGNFTSANLDKNEKGIYNPVAMAYESNRYSIDDRVRPVFTLRYAIIPKLLEYTGTVAFDISSNKSKGALPQSATGRPWTENTVNRVQDSDNETFITQIYNTLEYKPKIGEHVSFHGLLRFNTTDKRTSAFSGTGSNTASIYLTDPANPSQLISVGSGLTNERSLQATAFGEFSFFDRYLIAGVLTMDGNSRFGPAYRYGYFPSLSGRWRISSEPFLRDVKFINDLSLKAGYGVSGKAPDKNYLYYSTYNSYNISYLGVLGVRPSGMQLNSLRWEKTGEINFGVVFNAFQNRVNLTFDWYRKSTNDLMFGGVGIPNTSGISNIYMNVGSMTNNGWELSIYTTPVRQKDLQVDFRLNFSRNQNLITSLSDNIPTEQNEARLTSNGSYMARIQEGNPLGSFYGYRYNGVYLNYDETIARDAAGNKIYTFDEYGNRIPVPMKFWDKHASEYTFAAGDAKYDDINNDGNIDYKDVVYLGNSNPLLLGGFGPNIKYKNWTLDAFFYFRYGFEIVNQTKMTMESMDGFNNQSTAVLRRWTREYFPENGDPAPSGLLPRALNSRGGGKNTLGSDRFVEDGSFLKFKSINLRYTFDKDLVKRIGMSDLSLNFTVYNLYTWTKYTGMNPEVSVRMKSGDIYSVGYDESKSPSNMDFMFGVNVTF